METLKTSHPVPRGHHCIYLLPHGPHSRRYIQDCVHQNCIVSQSTSVYVYMIAYVIVNTRKLYPQYTTICMVILVWLYPSLQTQSDSRSLSSVPRTHGKSPTAQTLSSGRCTRQTAHDKDYLSAKESLPSFFSGTRQSLCRVLVDIWPINFAVNNKTQKITIFFLQSAQVTSLFAQF